MKNQLGIRQLRQIDTLVQHFVDNKYLFSTTMNSILGSINISPTMKNLIHSIKDRVKDPDHLKDKLIRKAIAARENKVPFDITKENLFSKINDLAGIRIIHLNTRQIEQIDSELKKIFDEQQWKLIEGPSARTWDDESRRYFQDIGIAVDPSPNLNMYTSVHYIIQPNSRALITCEIQVRTLMEEVWGEVDHSINYPHKSKSLACREQIMVLARVTSSCSRLVDSIFRTHEAHIAQTATVPTAVKPIKSAKKKSKKLPKK